MPQTEIQILNHLPVELLSARTEDLCDILGGPTVINLGGKRPRPLVASSLLHGNEHAGFYAVQRFLQMNIGELPRSLIWFIGNVEAAKASRRRLEHQPDYNRIWTEGPRPENKMAMKLKQFIKEQRPFAAIDIHNNTGKNPHFVNVNVLEKKFLFLAHLFSEHIVYFTEPKEIFANAISEICPSVTLECGIVGDESGVDHAYQYLHAIMHLPEIYSLTETDDIHFYESVARMMVPPDTEILWEDQAPTNPNYIQLSRQIEEDNFKDVAKGSPIATFGGDGRILVMNQKSKELTDDYLSYSGNQIQLSTDSVPSMLTSDLRVIRQDCLGYLMVRRRLEI